MTPKVEVTEAFEYTDRSYECARWWCKYEIQPGIYDVVETHASYRHFVADGIVVEDNFSAGGWGHVLPYDKSKNAGKPSKVRVPWIPTYLDGKPELQKAYRIPGVIELECEGHPDGPVMGETFYWRRYFKWE